MKVRVRRPFTYQVSATKTETIAPGVHDLPKELVEKILRFGKAELVVEKKAPENKLRGHAPESKKKVGKKSVRSRGTWSKSD